MASTPSSTINNNSSNSQGANSVIDKTDTKYNTIALRAMFFLEQKLFAFVLYGSTPKRNAVHSFLSSSLPHQVPNIHASDSSILPSALIPNDHEECEGTLVTVPVTTYSGDAWICPLDVHNNPIECQWLHSHNPNPIMVTPSINRYWVKMEDITGKYFIGQPRRTTAQP